MLLTVFEELASRNIARLPLKSIVETVPLEQCRLTRCSRFLDVGSGLGKIVLHMSLASGCKAAGIEILSSRVKLAVEFRDKLVAKNKVPSWIAQTTSFATCNAAIEKGPLLVDGAHATHVFMFSVVFSDHDLALLADRLN